MELLKLRFGEAPMHFCEVMLKVGTRALHSHLVPPPPRPSGGLSPQDMADSRRINANIREEDEKRPAEEQPPFGVYAVILSSEFWPPFKDEKLEVPEDIREALEVYCRKYEKLKVGPRCWESSSVLRDPCPPLSRDPCVHVHAPPRVRTCPFVCVRPPCSALPGAAGVGLDPELPLQHPPACSQNPGLAAMLSPGHPPSPLRGCLQGASWLLLGCLAAPLGLLRAGAKEGWVRLLRLRTRGPEWGEAQRWRADPRGFLPEPGEPACAPHLSPAHPFLAEDI